jgi:general secretion pathway protein D
MTHDAPTFRHFPPRRSGLVCTTLLALALAAGCATGRAIRTADEAAKREDWDTAVTYYRQALAEAPDRVDVRTRLERSTRMASAEHMARARTLEVQEQLSGAIAEYRLAAELDPSNSLAFQKAGELERRLRQQLEATRPPTGVAVLREQAAQTSSIPRLPPNTIVPEMRFPNAAVRDILSSIANLTGINIIFDAALDARLSRPFPIDVQNVPLEEVLNQVLQANGLAYEIRNTRSIFVYEDTGANRAKYEAQYFQPFHISNADPADIMAQLQLLVGGTPGLTSVRPVITLNKGTNTINVRASASMLQVIEAFIRANDRARPEVFIEAEILEVDRSFLRQIGLDLNNWALGFAFSPEVSPSLAPGTLPPVTPPPFNLNTLSRGVSPADFYVTTPTALVRLLESHTNTRVLSKPSQRGTSGSTITLTMGQDIPIPTTQFFAGAAGGVNNIPSTSVEYQPVGVNVKLTPTVTYDDEIILSELTLEKSGLGANLDIGGQSFPTIVSRKASITATRLRDGESTIIAGLLLDEERREARSLPGIANVPVLRSIFGGTEKRIEETDIIMIITPRIVRGYGLTADDVRPRYVGTGQTMQLSPSPPMLNPDAAPASAAPQTPTAPSVPAPQAAPAPSVAPIVPVPSASAPAAPAQGQAQIILSAPAAGPAGALLAGGGPHTMPIQIAGVADLATLTLTVTFDPSVIRTPAVTAGSFMSQGGVASSFVPGVDAGAGRIDMAFSRPGGGRGAAGSGLLGAITFTAGDAGSTDVRITGVGTTSTGQSVVLQFTPARVTVR